MKILVMNPNSDENTNELMKKAVARFLDGFDGIEVDFACCKNAPKLVGSYEDQSRSAAELVEMVRAGKEYDAFVVACHSDPNLDLVKEVAAPRPAVGIAEASMKVATMSGNGFAVVSPSPKSISKKMALARKYHCDHLLRTVKVSKSDAPEDLLAAAQEAKEEFCVDGIVLGCANYAGADGYVEQRLGIPVYDGVVLAVWMAAGLARYADHKK